MAKILNKKEIAEFHFKIDEIPDFIKELSQYECAEVLKFAENLKSDRQSFGLNEFDKELKQTKKSDSGTYKVKFSYRDFLDNDYLYGTAINVIKKITDYQAEPQKAETPETPERKPVFNPDQIETIFDLLKNFFSNTDQTKLKEILKTGNNTSTPLIFLSTGNRLADSFKELIQKDFITGCNKKELEAWIYTNFNFMHSKKVKAFTLKYLNDIISTNKPLCKKQILVVKKDNQTKKDLISKP